MIKNWLGPKRTKARGGVSNLRLKLKPTKNTALP